MVDLVVRRRNRFPLAEAPSRLTDPRTVTRSDSSIEHRLAVRQLFVSLHGLTSGQRPRAPQVTLRALRPRAWLTTPVADHRRLMITASDTHDPAITLIARVSSTSCWSCLTRTAASGHTRGIRLDADVFEGGDDVVIGVVGEGDCEVAACAG